MGAQPNWLRQIQNFIYFHRRRIGINALAVTTFGGLAYKCQGHPNENLRMAFGGCIAHVAVETSFHMMDTVNIRSKANP
jgi:hypothetical protein